MAFTTQWMVVATRRSSRRPRECDQARYRHGNDPPRSLICSFPIVLVHATLLLLCVAIVLQMLGVPITLLDTTGADDPFQETVNTAYALPTGLESLGDVLLYTLGAQWRLPHQQLVTEHCIDRPPPFSQSPPFD